MKKIILTALLLITTTIAVLAQDAPEPWDGSISKSLTVQGKTIYIFTAPDLIALHDLWDDFEEDGHHGYDGYTILLMNDLDLNNRNIQPLTIGWTSSHRFAGVFNGQGHTISNVYIGGNEDNRGLFGWLCGGDVLNLKLMNVTIEAGDGGNDHVGAICGRMDNHSLISHCAVVGGTVRLLKDGADEVGAICGYMAEDKNVIEYCYSDVDVWGDTQVGGIVGKIEQPDGSDKSEVRHCYFSGTVHHGDEYFAAIAGERYSSPLNNNFYLNRNDGVKGTGNQKKYDGSSDDPNAAGKTDAELKAPLLFGADDLEWIYPLDGYPELKVFLRYNTGDSFYTKNIGNMGGTPVPGYLKIVDNGESPYSVSLEKSMAVTGTDFTINETFQPYFSDQQLKTVALGNTALEGLGMVNTVTLPVTIDSIATPLRHQVQNAFILNGMEGAVKDFGLYDVARKHFITAPKTLSTLTIHQEFADSIADYAFENMTNLSTLYVDTYLPPGTLVDDRDNLAPVIKLGGNNIFNGCSADLDVYIKDGTANELFLGYQGPKGFGYSNAKGWNLFYSEYEDIDSHMFTYFPINRNAGGMSTLILGYPVELPEGVTAWWATSLKDGNVNLQQLGTQIVPALTPVLLTYEGTGPLYLTRYTGPNPGAATDYENNLFKGSVDPGGHNMTSSELMSNFFTLGRPAGDDTYNHMGFYQYHPKNNILPAYVAWLANSDIPSGARFVMDFGNGTTLIENSILKPIPNNELIIYTMQGVRISPSAMRKGTIYIKNGKKFIFK